MLTGVIPESIMIGVGQPLDDDCQRTYEMTYAPCDPTISNQCHEGYSLTECYGGNSLYLSFIIDTLVPSVLMDLNISLGEVSIYGFSLGGLAACNAVLDRPDFFARAMCSSPSFWFNYGDFSKRIADTFAADPLHTAPKAVVMSLGTAEDGLYPNLQNPEEYTYWTEFISDVKDAWLEVGLDKTTLAYFTLTGGIHTGISYADDVLLESAKSLYKHDFPMPDKDQASAYIIYAFPEDSSGSNDDANDHFCQEERVTIVVIAVLLGLTWAGIV
jgi:hypothetical protein